jgi:hypothetical protein
VDEKICGLWNISQPQKGTKWGGEHHSLVGHLPGVLKALGSFPDSLKERNANTCPHLEVHKHKRPDSR